MRGTCTVPSLQSLSDCGSTAYPPSALKCLQGSAARHPLQEAKIRGSNPACDKIFSGLSHTNDLKIGTPLATLPGSSVFTADALTTRPTRRSSDLETSTLVDALPDAWCHRVDA